MKKQFLAAMAIIALVLIIGFSPAISNNQSLAELMCNGNEGGIVDKAQTAEFAVEIGFKNTGRGTGEWSVNVAFEGEKWSWTGTQQSLRLTPSSNKTLSWDGTVPESAPIDSVARLVVYYDGSFQALDWWIHVVPGAHLMITSSSVA